MESTTGTPVIKYLDKEIIQGIKNDFTGQPYYVLVNEKKWFLTAAYEQQYHVYNDIKVNSDDVWLVAIPRSGTTLTQEMVWLLDNDMDFETASTISLNLRFPMLESALYSNDFFSLPRKNVKTHYPLDLIPNTVKSNCKIIYVARNPKDLAVSYYYFQTNFKYSNFHGDFEKYWNYFQNGQIVYTPYWEHVKEGWSQRHNSNFLFLFYEEMIQDLLAVIKRVSKFLGKSYTEEQYKELFNHLQFSNFKKSKTLNATKNEEKVLFTTEEDNFIRQGKKEAWHNMFTPELNAQANRWIAKNLEGSDLQFPFVDVYS